MEKQLTDKIRHYHLKDMQFDAETNSIVSRVHAQVVELMDKAIVDACINEARDFGMNDLFLLDHQFVMDALREKIQGNATVKRAKWAFPEGGITGCVVCSNCRTYPISKNGRWVLTKYCPNCGAKMEE